MADQYRKIADLDTILYHADSPVVVERMRLQHDLIYNVNVLQITFRSVEPLNIYGLGVVVSLENEEGRKIYKDIEFNYYGIEVQTGHLFGSEEDIVVEPDAARFRISVVRADLAEGKRFRGKVLLAPAPAPPATATLGEFEQPFIDRMAKLRPRLKVLCAPDTTDTYWHCICQRIYPRSITMCPSCRMKYQTLFDILPQLREEKKQREAEEARLEKERQEEEARLQREEEERRRAEEEQRRKEEEQRRLEEEQRRREEEERRLREEELARQKKKKRKKQALIGGSSLIAAAAIVCLVLLLPDRGGVSVAEETPVAETEYHAEVKTTAPPVKTTPAPAETPAAAEPAPEAPKPAPTVLLGEDLDETESKTVWRLFGRNVNEEDYTHLFIGSQEQRIYMEALFGKKVEERALSSVLVTPKDAGSGLTVRLYNITGCSEERYLQALEFIGVTDAEVIVAAPQKCSGSTALAGLYLMAGELGDYAGKGIGTAVSRGYINVRSGCSTAYDCYATVEPGMELEVLEIMDNGWLRVVWPAAEEGYAFTAYSAGNNGSFYDFVPNS